MWRVVAANHGPPKKMAGAWQGVAMRRVAERRAAMWRLDRLTPEGCVGSSCLLIASTEVLAVARQCVDERRVALRSGAERGRAERKLERLTGFPCVVW